MPLRQPSLTSAAALSFAILAPRNAFAEGWTPSATEFPTNAESVAAGEFGLRGGWSAGLVPPFRAGERDRLALGADARGWVGTHIRLTLSEEWLTDTTAAGSPVSGFGDFRVGTALAVLNRPTFAIGAGWEGKLPNADDAGELGTDETDFTFGLWGGVSRGRWSGIAALGIGILGNPLRFANQDDVPVARLNAAFSPGPFQFSAGVSADLQTSRNPAHIEALAAIRYGKRWFIEIAGTAGFVPAAANESGTLRFGYAWALPEPPAGE